MSEALNRAKCAVANSISFKDQEVKFLRQAVRELIEHAEEVEELHEPGIEFNMIVYGVWEHIPFERSGLIALYRTRESAEAKAAEDPGFWAVEEEQVLDSYQSKAGTLSR